MKDFKQELKKAGLSIAAFCRETATPRTTVDNWLYHNVRIPGVVRAWLRLRVASTEAIELLQTTGGNRYQFRAECSVVILTKALVNES